MLNNHEQTTNNNNPTQENTVEFIDSIEPVYFISAVAFIFTFSVFNKNMIRIEAKLDNVHRRMDGKKIRVTSMEAYPFWLGPAFAGIAVAATYFVSQKIPFVRDYDWSKPMADYWWEGYAIYGVCLALFMISVLAVSLSTIYLIERWATRKLVLNMSESQARKIMGEPDLIGLGYIWIYDQRWPPIELFFTDGRLRGMRLSSHMTKMSRSQDEDGEQE